MRFVHEDNETRCMKYLGASVVLIREARFGPKLCRLDDVPMKMGTLVPCP